MRFMLTTPIMLLIFAAAIGGLWAWRRHNLQVAALALGFALFAAGLLVQLTQIPPGTIPNSLVSTSLYCAGTLALARGLLLRAQAANRAKWAPVLLAAMLLAATWYFVAVDDNLVVRVYVVNFGLGAIILAAAWSSRALARGETTDKVLFWVFVLLGLHFFPRTMLTAGSIDSKIPAEFAQTSFWTGTVFAFAVFGAIVGLTIIIVIMADMVRAAQRERDTDSLTGVANRRGLEGAAAAMLADPANAPLSLVMCDLDNFKTVNDRFGHQVGDLVLKTFAETLSANARADDVLARMGGEEFVVLLPRLTAEQGLAFAERLRLAAAATSFQHVAPNLYMTCSMGVVQIRPRESLADAIFRADELVYAAKHNGRNRTYAEGIGPAGRNPGLRKL